MISVPEVVVERVAAAIGSGESLVELAIESARVVLGSDRVTTAGPAKTLTISNRPHSTLIDTMSAAPVAVIAATFSNPERFPSLAVRVAASLGLPSSVAAFDVQMACSAYPYALYLAGRLSADIGGKVLVIDGDVQSPLVDTTDHATGKIFSDACTATVVCANPGGTSRFDFLSCQDEALECGASGPIKMDGFKVFSFVATEVSKFLKDFLASSPAPDFFAPHQANPYMVRQLADALELKEKLLTIPEELKNPGSCSVPLALAHNAARIAGTSILIAGFGAGYSVSAGTVRIAGDYDGKVL